MISGTYWEFICPTCGFFPQVKIEYEEQEKPVKKLVKTLAINHLMKHTEKKDFLRAQKILEAIKNK